MKLSRKIMLGLSLVIILVNAGVLHVVGRRYQMELREELTEAGRSYYKLIVVVRAWIAHNEGVFVRQAADRAANPYLPTPLVQTVGGDTLVWRNPAMVTRELSELSRQMGNRFHFHIASLQPMNPANSADEFEREALLAVSDGDRRRLSKFGEFTRYETIEGVRHFRYFAPLYTDASCLSCHRGQGYDVGDVRGGISILIPTDQLAAASAENFVLTLVASLGTSAAISLLLLGLIQRNVVRPLRRLEDAAEEIGKGNYDTPILADSADEIGDVGRAMAKMQQAIRRRLRKQVQTEKMVALGQLSAGIAHEIRNPLFAINNDLDFLQRNYPADEQQAEVYGSMEQGLRRIGSTVDAVLGYARPHKPQYGLHTVDEVLRRCMVLLGKQLQKNRVELSVALAPDLPAIEMDVHRMEQVLINLLANAMRACSPQGGRIQVAATCVDGIVEVRVSDDGVGIPAADLSRIFDPFFTRSRDGTGLGLTIVRRIIDQHHGSIDVDSEPGAGTTFILTLPLKQPHPEAVTA
jgi:two-component system, NtrC family, sensor kinase